MQRFVIFLYIDPCQLVLPKLVSPEVDHVESPLIKPMQFIVITRQRMVEGALTRKTRKGREGKECNKK
jgi:hypothetical protein